VVDVCHESWRRRERRREDRLDEEIRDLLHEEQEPRRPRTTPVVEHEREAEPERREKDPIEA
jgi:hypothetical protein